MPGGTLSGPQDVIPTKKRPRSSTPDTGDLRPVVLQEVLADQMQTPLPTADRKFKFMEGDWFVRMPVSYSTSMHKKAWFFTARAGTITLAAQHHVLWCTACGLAHHCGPQCVLASCWIDLQPIRQAVCCSSTERSCNFLTDGQTA